MRARATGLLFALDVLFVCGIRLLLNVFALVVIEVQSESNHSSLVLLFGALLT